MLFAKEDEDGLEVDEGEWLEVGIAGVGLGPGPRIEGNKMGIGTVLEMREIDEEQGHVLERGKEASLKTTSREM